MKVNVCICSAQADNDNMIQVETSTRQVALNVQYMKLLSVHVTLFLVIHCSLSQALSVITVAR